jgi:AcrR family transcriptional regulator
VVDSINRRERKKINSKKAIVDAAVKLFSQKGYQETAVADIMNEADLGIGTFYNYFQSKEEILKSLLSEIVEEINQFFETLLKEPKPASEVLTEMCLLTAKILDKNRFVLPLFLSAANKSAMPKEHMHPASGLTFKSIFDSIIKNGQETGEFRQDIPAELITEMFHSVFQAASFSSLEMSFMTNIQYKLTLILDGIVLKK